MNNHEFEVKVIKEKDFTEEQKEYLRKLEKAAEPTRKWIESLRKDLVKQWKSV